MKIWLVRLFVICQKDFSNTVPIGYSDLGYSGRAGYSDLSPNGTWSSCITLMTNAELITSRAAAESYSTVGSPSPPW